MTENGAAFQLGHWTHPKHRTGCSVLLFDTLTPAVVDVRGGAPGTRETDLLRSGSLVGAVDAILLTGGSAFGLAAADGVMRFLRERGRGVPTSGGPVPIVSSAVLFDLEPGELIAPEAGSGYAACTEAQFCPEEFAGRVGAGVGATYQKMWGESHVRRGGIGVATVRTDSGSVTAVLALNAVGAFAGRAGASESQSELSREQLLAISPPLGDREATTIGAVIVDGVADRDLLTRCSIAAHDGLARSIVPSHTIHDGDIFWAAGLRSGAPSTFDRMRFPLAAEIAVERAISLIATLPQR